MELVGGGGRAVALLAEGNVAFGADRLASERCGARTSQPGTVGWRQRARGAQSQAGAT